MKKKIDKQEAKRILGKVQISRAFWLCTSENLRSLEEVAKALGRATDEIFRFHVNRHKNDFESWIKDVVMDKELARDISRVKTRETLVRKMMERIERLKKIAGRGRKIFKKRVSARKSSARSKTASRKPASRRKTASGKPASKRRSASRKASSRGRTAPKKAASKKKKSPRKKSAKKQAGKKTARKSVSRSSRSKTRKK